MDFARDTFAALGTQAVVLTTAISAIEPATDAVRTVVADIDRACSRFRDDSDLSRVNESSGRAVTVAPLLLDAVDVALRAARLTDGIVDPTVGDALVVLGYDRNFATLDTAATPTARLGRVPGWQAVHLDRLRSTITVPTGTRLDLGATAKAFAADLAACAAYRAVGCGVLVSLGGDLRVWGEPPTDGWPVRVTDWQGAGEDAEGQTVAVLSGGLATSSVTVRQWQRGDEQVHHLINPRTGRSAQPVWRTVSAAASTCADANIATTAAVILGHDAEAWLRLVDLPARLVAVDGAVRILNNWAAEAA